MAKTRVGFVGCGGIAEAHLGPLSKRDDVDLVGFTDLSDERLTVVKEKYGAQDAQTFSAAADMFGSVEMDAAYFCLPPFAHGDELLAIERGIPFLVEKPVNLYVEQAQEIAAAAREKGVMSAIGYMNRYRAGVQRVRAMLQDDPGIMAYGGWIGGTPRGSGGSGIGAWWPVKDRSGGQFHEQVTHTVDVVLWLFGMPVEIHAYAATGLNRDTAPQYDIEDAMVVNMRFANNSVANLWSSCSSNGGGGGVSLNVYANDVTAQFTGWEHSVRILTDGGKNVEEIPGEDDIFAIEDDHFIRAVSTGDASLIQGNYDDGVNAIRVTLAADESFKTGRPVSLA